MNVLAGSISTRRVTTRQRECLRALVLAAVLMFASVRAIAGNDRDVDIRIHVEGDVVSVDASMLVAATPLEVWSVFTDFDHMAQFISNLKSSAVVARSGDTVTVAQAGEASYGPLKFAFESVRELRLMPVEKIRSHMISGNMKRFAGVTEFAKFTTLLWPALTGPVLMMEMRASCLGNGVLYATIACPFNELVGGSGTRQGGLPL